MQIRAAVIRQPGAIFDFATLDVDALRDDEVLVRLVASGICHADLNSGPERPLPMVLGHEGAGIVERVGTGVRDLQPGDHVILGPDSCGACRYCLSGHSSYCRSSRALNFGGTRLDGTSALSENGRPVFGHYFGQSSFGTYSVATQRNAIKVDPSLPLELLGPLGCGVETGAGTVFNVFQPKPGSSIAIFGVGSVGMSALLAALVAGCATIIAIDIKSSRLDFAKELGATHVVDASSTDATAEVLRITGTGVDYAFTTVAGGDAIRRAVSVLDIMGRCAFVAGGGDVALTSSSIAQGKTVGGVSQGDSVPKVFIPRLIDLWQAGRFPFDRLVTFYPFGKINGAARDSLSGDVIKPILRFD